MLSPDGCANRSERLKRSRALANLSQIEMASALARRDYHAHQASISRWENGDTPLDEFRLLQAWAAICGVREHWLVHGTGPMLAEKGSVPPDSALFAPVAELKANAALMRLHRITPEDIRFLETAEWYLLRRDAASLSPERFVAILEAVRAILADPAWEDA